jgi:hypothetical protein
MLGEMEARLWKGKRLKIHNLNYDMYAYVCAKAVVNT